jgi:hypothetical protein
MIWQKIQAALPSFIEKTPILHIDSQENILYIFHNKIANIPYFSASFNVNPGGTSLRSKICKISSTIKNKIINILGDLFF